MWRWWAVMGFAVVLAILALDTVTPARAQNWALSDRGFRLDWEPAATKRGTAIRGYVYNDLGYEATKIQLVIDSLDPGGQVVATMVGYLSGTAPAFNRLYFEVPVKAPASTYRVRIAAWEPASRGGM